MIRSMRAYFVEHQWVGLEATVPKLVAKLHLLSFVARLAMATQLAIAEPLELPAEDFMEREEPKPIFIAVGAQ